VILKNSRGSTTLIELLAVISLSSLLLPLVIGLLTESQDRLSPVGKAGQEVRIYQTGNAILTRIRDDLDRTSGLPAKSGPYKRAEGDLILSINDTAVIYHKECEKFYRITSVRGDKPVKRLLSRHLADFRLNLQSGRMVLELTLTGRRTEDPFIHFSTVFAIPG